jgi:ABC-type antimicrobial peptide transport system permease subunit
MWILHLGLGDRMVYTDALGRERKLVIAGLLSRSVFQSQLIASEANFLSLEPDHSGYNTFLIETNDTAVGTQLEEQWADYGFDATTTSERLAGYLVVENTYLSTFQTLGGLGLLLGVLGLAVVMVRNVLERRGELALLQAVGFGRRAVVHLVLAENGWLLIFGVLAGTGAALLAVLPRLVAGLAHPPWGSLLLTLSAIVLTGLISGAIAVRRSMAHELLPSLRRE